MRPTMTGAAGGVAAGVVASAEDRLPAGWVTSRWKVASQVLTTSSCTLNMLFSCIQ